MDEDIFAGHVVPSVSIDNMVNRRTAVLERVRSALQILREARDIARAANIGFPRFKFNTNRYEVSSLLDDERAEETAGEVAKEIDGAAWQHLLNESGLRTFMDSKARTEWNHCIEKGEFPAFTMDNIRSTFADLHAARGAMFERGVIACFKGLSWNYKTNKPFRFGKRLVLRGLRSSVIGAGRSLGWPNNRVTNDLDDLTRVLTVLDGKPEPDHRAGWNALIKVHAQLGDPDAENEYLSVRSFRNGNGHVTFKRPDLVDKMNNIIARHYPGALAHDPHADTRVAA